MDSVLSKTGEDWNQQWKKQMVKHEHSHHHCDCSGFWNNTLLAQEYHRMTRSCHWKQTLIQIIRDQISDITGCSLVDIGAGPGVHSIPLSQCMDHIVSVEPSPAMIHQLRKEVDDRSIKNITMVQKRWEDVDIITDLYGGCDIVLSSFSLGMYDLTQAIDKMRKASSQYVFLIWHQGISQWEKTYIDLWPIIHQTPYQMMPKDDVLFNVLAKQGIHPHIQPFQSRSFYHFSSFSHALRYFTTELRIRNLSHQQLLSSYLSKNLIRDNGDVVMDGMDRYVILWWEN